MKEYSKTYYLSAGECTPQGELPLPLLVNRVIDIATLHANEWGVGYERLIADGHAWVLARVAVEMKRYPRVNEYYSLTTWIEDYNHMFSQRNMMVRDQKGRVIGYVRTIWMVIDLKTRQSVDISQLSYIRENISKRKCPIAPPRRIPPATEGFHTTHTFGYTECDFNRHVNTVRHIEQMLNLFSIRQYDERMIHRMEIAFLKEVVYGQEVGITCQKKTPCEYLISMHLNKVDHVRGRIVFRRRPQPRSSEG